MTVSFETLGCRLNQLETESIAETFRAAGFEIVPSRLGPDITVVNTCTVTSMAEQKGRRLVRQAGRRGGCVIVTGCYAELGKDEIAALGGNVVVVPLSRKDTLLDLASWLVPRLDGHGEVRDLVTEWDHLLRSPGDREGARFRFNAERFEFHSRASLKIQDGCDNACTYCRVRLARGKAVSIAPDEALGRARILEGAGFREIVLTGINLAQYSHSGLRFPDLLALLLEGTGETSFRISSWEPEHVDDAFCAAAANPRVRPFFHLAVQSLSDPVLRAMGRHYDSARVARAVKDLGLAKPGAFLGADVITGFPGESDEEFAVSRDKFDRLGFSWLHVFTFSPRPGTAAALMKPRVAERVATERTAELSALAERKKRLFALTTAGVRVKAIVERDGILMTEHGLRLEPVPGTTLPPPRSEIDCSLSVTEPRAGDDAEGDLDGQALVFRPD